MNQLQADVEQSGFAVVPDVLTEREVQILVEAILKADNQNAVRKRCEIYAIRNLIEIVPEVARLSTHRKIIELVHQVLGSDAIPVKGTLFDKTADANWLVPWHQDLTICVRDRVEAPGYGPWTIKAGVVNVQPPVSILEELLAVRIHLDDTDEQNGVLRVLPGTHKQGRLSAEQMLSAQSEGVSINCAVKSGGVVLMRPLLMHASYPALRPTHRRVIHLDFAAVDLPQGMFWISAAK